MKTFWLYFGTLLITAVRMPANSDSTAIKYKAREDLKSLSQNELVPYIYFCDIKQFE